MSIQAFVPDINIVGCRYPFTFMLQQLTKVIELRVWC